MWKYLFLFLVFFTSCTKPPETQMAVAQAETETPANPAGKGSIQGTVTYTKSVPPAKPISMSADPNCAKAYKAGEKSTFQEIEVGPNKSLANAFVYIKTGAPKTAAPTTPVTLDQRGCRYHPHVMGIQVGQPLKILNSDPTLHNVHSLAKANASFNVGMSTVGQTIEKTFTKPEVMIRVKCDVHGWMHMFIGVVENPYYAVTGEDGKFDFKGLGPGQYMVEVWHEKLGTQTGTATIGSDQGETKVDFKW